jgi:hypothetical protein
MHIDGCARYLSPWFRIPGEKRRDKGVIYAAEALSRTAKAMDGGPKF